MTRTVRLTVAVTVNEGKLADFEEIAGAMADGAGKEPGTLGYDWHFSADRVHWLLLETYANPEALVAHFKGPVVQQLVPKIMQVSKVDRIEVCGDPGPEGAGILTSFGASCFSRWRD